MSLNRLIFYGAIIGGWAAFVGWLLAEPLLGGSRSSGFLATVLMIALVGAAISGGLSMLPALVNRQWLKGVQGLGIGLLGGLLAGLVSGLIGNGFFALVGTVGRIPGWVIMGLAIGAVEGIYRRSPHKLRNGLIGGAIGGFIGGLLFDPITHLLHSGSGMASRATAFVILGMCIGLFIAVVQVVLKQAWLTVVDGFRPGRQLILSETEASMGTSERVTLPFIAFGAKGVEPVHVRIVRQPDGRYVAMDNNTRTGTRVNGHPLAGPAVLRDGDVIAFGVNMVRFSERHRGFGAEPAALPAAPVVPVRAAVAAAVQPAPVQPVAIQAVPVQAVPVQPRPVPVRPVAPVPPAVAQPPVQARPPAPPAQPRPPAAVPPTAQPPRPAPVAQQPAPPRPPAAVAPCPNCGIRVAGAPGSRVCGICGLKF